jgi:hypothetical protein
MPKTGVFLISSGPLSAPTPVFCIAHFIRRLQSRHLVAPAMLLSLVFYLAACAPLSGYAENPEDTDVVIETLMPYFSGEYEQTYYSLPPDDSRRLALRNTIIINRMRVYEINFLRFKKRLWGDTNAIAAGGDLLVLALTGLAATTGNAGTKSALAAASAGIVGAQGAINKDIYYQRTLPAVLSQIQANRDHVKAILIKGLSLKDSEHPLTMAGLDLEALQAASGIPDAVGVITGQAAQNQADAQEQVTEALFSAKLLPVDVQARKAKCATFVRGVSDRAQLDAIANVLGVTTSSTSIRSEQNAILREMDKRVQSSEDMQNLSTRLNGRC